MKTLLLASVCVVASLTACDRLKSISSEEDAAAAAVPPATATAAATAATPAAATATAAAATGAVVAAGATPTAPATPTPGTTVANGDKKVVVGNGPNGAALNLQNDAGKGSVTQVPGGVNVQGKSGKAITIPTNIPGMPVAK